MANSPSKMDVDGMTAQPPADIPAAYIQLIDSRCTTTSPQIYPIWDQQIFKIGRDPGSNTLAIDNDPDCMVSRNHCEFYVVMYEPTINHIFVRDRKSCNGTWVNGHLIGSVPKISPGYLLRDGDVVEIRPFWKFVVAQDHSPPRTELTSLQSRECEEFANKYTITDRSLGRGAEAIVYLAVETSTKKQLVCKLVNLDKTDRKANGVVAANKLQETDILRQLRHPNILPYVDAVTTPHSLYTFTELASGGDLMSFLYRHDVVREFDCRIIIRQVVRGLRYLHSKGIVHRDLKPENILLACSPRIAYHRVMLSDFGNSAVPQRNRMLTNVGTTCYQAPEISIRSEVHTAAVDIWSLGVVVFLLLTSSSDVDFEGINKMEQKRIEILLRAGFSRSSRKISSHAKQFAWGCLQTNPSMRMNACEAGCHDWLCTPEKHLEFFRTLDRRIIREWEDQIEIRPMPMELPDLAKTSSLCADTALGIRSQYFSSTTKEESPLESEQLVHESNNSPPDVSREVSSPRTLSAPTPGLTEYSRETEGDETESKQSQPPWEGFPKPISFAKPSNPAKRKRSVKIKVKAAALLPLTNLERHLQPTPSNIQREQVLEELKKSNSKFLVESNSAMSMTPLQMNPLQRKPLIPKKQKSKMKDSSQTIESNKPGTRHIKFR